MKKSTTKRALLLSVLSLMLCISMLIGTTYAWFTDSVTTGVNQIQSGTLEVDMVDAAGKSLEGKTLSFRDKNGNKNILWEPGATFELDKFAIVNKGNLALKYKIVINGLSGDAELLKVIKFTVDGTPLEQFNISDKMLKPGEKSALINLAGTMDPAAGNEYQNKKIDGISITVYATQVESEYDSNGNTYDASAEYLEVPVAKVTNDGVQTIPNAEAGTTLFDGSNWVGGNAVQGPIDLATSFTFIAPDDAGDFADWNADFVVSVDKDIPANSVILAGMYHSFAPNTWVAFHNPMDVKAGEEIRLLEPVLGAWTYEAIVNQVKEFSCGVAAADEDIMKGVTLTVALKLFETKNGEEVAEHTIGTYSYTFGVEEENISDVKVVSNADEIEKAVAEAGEEVVIVLNDDIDEPLLLEQNDRKIVIEGNGKTITESIKLDGNSEAYNDSETLVIRNVNFETDEKDMIFIDSNNAVGTVRYAHNVLVENCTFTATGAAYRTATATKLRQCFNNTFKNCTGIGLHSFAQNYGGAGNVFDGITLIDCKNGISIGAGQNNVIKNCVINTDVAGAYGIRADGTETTSLTLENNKINAFIPVLVRNLTGAYTLNVDATNTLTATGSYGQIVLSNTDVDDQKAPTAPTGGYTLNAPSTFTVWKG